MLCDDQVELLQCGPTGDLVVGRDQLPVASVINQGTVVHWFQLTSLDEEVTGELCTVLRYLQGRRGGGHTHCFLCHPHNQVHMHQLLIQLTCIVCASCSNIQLRGIPHTV
jgi:hypothetical protein